MKPREILDKNIWTTVVIAEEEKQGWRTVRQIGIDKALTYFRKWIEGKKNGYDMGGVAEKIGALMMGVTKESMEAGFRDYKGLKKIKDERNIGYNQALDDLLKDLEDL